MVTLSLFLSILSILQTFNPLMTKPTTNLGLNDQDFFLFIGSSYSINNIFILFLRLCRYLRLYFLLNSYFWSHSFRQLHFQVAFYFYEYFLECGMHKKSNPAIVSFSFFLWCSPLKCIDGIHLLYGLRQVSFMFSLFLWLWEEKKSIKKCVSVWVFQL